MYYMYDMNDMYDMYELSVFFALHLAKLYPPRVH